MNDETQALCFMAGANSIFTGDKPLNMSNANAGENAALFANLGLTPTAGKELMRVEAE